MGERNLTSRLLLDTHILIRLLTEPKRLSREQERVLDQAVARGEFLSISAATLIEIASVFGKGSTRSHLTAEKLFDDFEAGEGFHVIPIDLAIGREVAAMGDVLRDLWDRSIVATARVHRLRLVTSDQMIIESKLVSVIE